MSIRINGKKYINGTVVRANPVEEATGTLEKIGIGSDVYEIQGVGGGGNALIMDAQIYSLDEQEVGVWTDGKPLYQKTVVLNSISTGENLYTLDFVNVDTIVAKEVSCIREPQGSTKDYIIDESILELWGEGSVIPQIWRVNANNVQVSLYSGYYTPTNISITLKYTKTTDVAGSGSYNTLGVPTVHYTTDEQVIGTWIDGKPLYRKTVTYTGVSGARNSLDLNIANVDFINLVPEGSCTDNRPLPYVTGTDNSNNIGGFFDVQTSTTTFEWRAGSGSTSSTDVILTVQYTKTTD